MFFDFFFSKVGGVSLEDNFNETGSLGSPTIIISNGNWATWEKACRYHFISNATQGAEVAAATRIIGGKRRNYDRAARGERILIHFFAVQNQKWKQNDQITI